MLSEKPEINRVFPNCWKCGKIFAQCCCAASRNEHEALADYLHIRDEMAELEMREVDCQCGNFSTCDLCRELSDKSHQLHGLLEQWGDSWATRLAAFEQIGGVAEAPAQPVNWNNPANSRVLAREIEEESCGTGTEVGELAPVSVADIGESSSGASREAPAQPLPATCPQCGSESKSVMIYPFMGSERSRLYEGCTPANHHSWHEAAASPSASDYSAPRPSEWVQPFRPGTRPDPKDETRVFPPSADPQYTNVATVVDREPMKCLKCGKPYQMAVNGVCVTCDPTGGGTIGYAPSAADSAGKSAIDTLAKTGLLKID